MNIKFQVLCQIFYIALMKQFFFVNPPPKKKKKDIPMLSRLSGTLVTRLNPL